MRNIIYNKIISLILCVVVLCFSAGCGDAHDGAGLIDGVQLADSSYMLGDYMGNYTVTDIYGNVHTFSEILKEKKAIVLNFWFINCGPCQMEFPYLQTAYNKYCDDLTVIAINPVDNKENNIKKYATKNDLTLPLAMGDQAWANAFNLRGFPTTVVIDRYGSVAFMHVGAITADGEFEKIFEFFVSDDYKQTVVSSINDIK